MEVAIHDVLLLNVDRASSRLPRWQPHFSGYRESPSNQSFCMMSRLFRTTLLERRGEVKLQVRCPGVLQMQLRDIRIILEYGDAV
jgi:hypothetical protein